MIVDKYSFDETADDLLSLLEEAHISDKSAEKKVKQFGCAAALCFFLLFGSLMVTFVTQFFGLLLLSLLLGAVGVTLGMKAIKLNQFDLDDRKLEMASQWIRILRADIPSKEKIHLEIDFRPYQKHGELVQKATRQNPATKYQQPWLWFETSLADGSTLSMKVIDRISRKEKRKRKYTKVKEKFINEIHMDLKLWKKYGEAQHSVDHTADVAPPSPLQVKSIHPEGRRLRAVFGAGPLVRVKGRAGITHQGKGATGDTLLQALTWLYHGMGTDRKSA